MRLRLALAAAVGLLTLLLPAPAAAQTTASHACPGDLGAWRATLNASWLDCHRVSDLTTTNNPYTDPNSLTGMGYPPPGSGTLNSKYTNPTTPAVAGLQLDGWFADDGCNAYQVEPALTAKNGAPFIPGCTPAPGGTCAAECHHDAQFVIRIPDGWNGTLLSAGTPGIRDAFASDFIFSDYALEKGWAYVSQDKGNMGANFYRDGPDETRCSRVAWCPGAAIEEWTYRMKQATAAARALLKGVAPAYGLKRLGRSYAAGISNGGYQVRRALETDTTHLYDGGVDWEGTLFLPALPAGVKPAGPATGYNLFTYLPVSLAHQPGALAGDPAAVAALAAVGFNPESQPLWAYHYGIYWGLTQKIYRLEMDPEYTAFTCSGLPGPPCASPPAEVVPPTDPDAAYDYAARLRQDPALLARMRAVANTGAIRRPLITLQGDQDALLPTATDADLYSQMVALSGRSASYRYYPIRGGNHVDPQFDDHYGVDSYGDNLLRPILPCARAAIDALSAWVDAGTPPPPSHTVQRPAGASAADLANVCSLA
ncbi:MAG TPA: tannase/feruloyl esterase family alpha/beta hydrolase [Candidatus Dormibacteraeota bacterium]